MNKIKSYFNDDLNRIRFGALIIFIALITLMAWQSDDAYHAYIMAKNLVEGNGFVYNIGERATASSCPLFTLVVAFGYLFIRKMFIVSLLICIVFSAWAFAIVVNTFCKNKTQVVVAAIIMMMSTAFMSYTSAGLENCQLFILTALFLKEFFAHKKYNTKSLLYLAILISLIAMTRMDAVLMFVPMILFVYLLRRDNVSFIKCVGLGITGLMPFILWELFSLFYFGFFVPNTAFVKLGTNIPKIEYIKRGIQYFLNTLVCDPLVLVIPFIAILLVIVYKKLNYIMLSLGVLLYGIYVIYIGGDFMMGRHFTVMFFMSVICILEIINKENVKFTCLSNAKNNDNDKESANDNKSLIRFIYALTLACVIYSATTVVITRQFTFGQNFNSPISDERAGYFKWTSLFNNTISYLRTGKLCILEAWNNDIEDMMREENTRGGILVMVPGITKYYYNDLYLNDKYALGDPFLSKLPAVREENWRIGHMWRECPIGYNETIMFSENCIDNESLREYYEVIKLITQGDLFDSNRIKAIIDINLGKYDHLVEEYKQTLNEDNTLRY